MKLWMAHGKRRTACDEPRTGAWGFHGSTTSSEVPGLPQRMGKGAKSWSRGLNGKIRACFDYVNKQTKRKSCKQTIDTFFKDSGANWTSGCSASDVCFSSQELQAELYVNARHQAGNNKHMFSMADQKNSYHRVEAVTSTCILCWECIRKLKGSRNRNPKKALSSTIP